MHEENILIPIIDTLCLLKSEEIASFVKKIPEDIYQNVYYDLDDWNKLKNIIVEWYKVKYPVGKLEMLSNKFKNKDKIIITPQDYNFAGVEKLFEHMGYSELMFRIPSKLHPLIECLYKGNLDGNIYLKNTNNREGKYFKISELDGSIIELDRSFDGTLLKKNCKVIKDFAHIINKQNYDVSEMERIVLSHDINLRLRELFFEATFYSIIKISENLLIGNVRALKFVEEFNKYIYSLNLLNSEYNLSKRIIDKNLEEEIIFILKSLKNETEDKSIEDFGLSFKTLKLLKSKGINKISNLGGKSAYNIIHEDGINNYNISMRDESILWNMCNLAETYFYNQEIERWHAEIGQKNNLEPAPKQKKKGLFKKYK